MPRCVLVALAATLVACAGCGGEPTPKPPATVSADLVGRRFERLTGERLKEDRIMAEEHARSLVPAGKDFGESSLYGHFQLSVYRDAGAARSAEPEVSDPKIWEKHRRFANLLLEWSGDSDTGPEADRQFAMLARVVRATWLNGKLPVGERPCEQVGLDPASDSGSCKQGKHRLIVASRGQRLETSTYDARVEDVKAEPRLRDATDPLGDAGNAKGIFIVAKVRVANRADDVYQRPSSAKLAVGERRIESSSLDYALYSDFPLGPGQSGETSFVFDVPESLEPRVMREGGIVMEPRLPVETEIGWLRLAR